MLGKPSCKRLATSGDVREGSPEEITLNLGLGVRDYWEGMDLPTQANCSGICTKVWKTALGGVPEESLVIIN